MAEYNLIQAPELLGRLARRLGMRQPHITPALNEGIQAVVVVSDLSTEGDAAADVSAGPVRQYSPSAWVLPAAGNDAFHQMRPVSAGSVRPGTTWRLIRMRCITDSATPIRFRAGFRDDAIGGAVLTTSYPNRVALPLPQPVAFQWTVGSLPSGNACIASNQTLVESYISASSPFEVFDGDLDVVVRADEGGFVVHLFQVGAGSAALATWSVWEEMAS